MTKKEYHALTSTIAAIIGIQPELEGAALMAWFAKFLARKMLENDLFFDYNKFLIDCRVNPYEHEQKN